MPRSRTITNDFSGGAIAPEFRRRGDIEQLAPGASELKNVIIGSAGTVARRCGSSAVSVLSGVGARLFVFEGASVVEHLVFRDSRVTIYSEAGTELQAITGAPWTQEQAEQMVIEPVRDGKRDLVMLYNRAFETRYLERASDGTWSLNTFTFSTDFDNALNQPYWRFEPPGVSMAVSAYTGTAVTVSFTQGFLTAQHVGVRFRYLERNEVEITAVTNATTATAIVRQRLFPTVTLTVPSTTGFVRGQVIQGEISERQAQIVTLGGTSMVVVMLDSYDTFEVIPGQNGNPDTIEEVVGPTGAVKPTAQTTASTPSSTTVWDEALISAARGYAGCGVMHRGRHMLSGFRQAPAVIASSAVNDHDNFKLSEDSAGAFTEGLGDDPNAEIRYLVSAEQLLIFTDRSLHYVPEGGEAPLTPTSVAFFRIGPEGCARIRPVLASDGVVFVHQDTGRLMACVPTGNLRRSWDVVDISETSSHLLTSPVALAAANGLDGRPERYLMCLQSDGRLVVASFRRNGDRFGYVQWEHGGDGWDAITSTGSEVFAASSQGSAYFLSRFSFDARVDDELGYGSAQTARNGLASQAVQSGQVIGSGTVADGVIAAAAPGTGRSIGADFEVFVETLPPYLGRIGCKRMRISKFLCELLDSGPVRINDVRYEAALFGPEIMTPGVTRSRVVRGSTLGWSEEPTLRISQQKGEGSAFTLRMLVIEVAY